jgi:hypothetical protein
MRHTKLPDRIQQLSNVMTFQDYGGTMGDRGRVGKALAVASDRFAALPVATKGWPMEDHFAGAMQAGATR